jgi:hypothetical protein
MSPILTIIGVTDERVGTIRIKRGSTGEAVGFKLEDTGTGLNGLALTQCHRRSRSRPVGAVPNGPCTPAT